jgi:hypothetical protein
MTRVCVAGVVACIFLNQANAAAQDGIVAVDPAEPAISLTPIADAAARAAATAQDDTQAPSSRPVAVELSDGYKTRAKIHKYASIATLPLFATEIALGESLYNNGGTETGGKRTAHAVVGTSLIALFGVNSVTGIWNLYESRTTPGHTKRLVHGLLMLGAEGGFVAAAASAPGHGRAGLATFDANRATHRDIALVSFGVGTAGYLLMLFTGGGH